MAEDTRIAARDLTRDGLELEPASPTYQPFTRDELDLALQGRTIINDSNAVVTDFHKAPAGSVLPYVGKVNGEQVYFDASGVSQSGMKLSLSTTEITNKGTQGESQTRGDGDEFVMNSLNYKEQVALRVLAAIIKHEPKPLDYDDSKIKLLVSQAFRFAVEFQNRAILFRQEEQGGGGTGEVDVDPDSLANNTEKILYNIHDTLKNGVTIKGEPETIGGTITPVQVKVSEVEITELPEVTIASMPDVVIDGTPDVQVTNTPNVRVSNMPSSPYDVNVLSLPSSNEE